MTIGAVLLDFDGTLADTHRAVLASVVKMFADWNRGPVDLERVRTGIAMGLTLDASIRTFDPSLNKAEVAEGMERYRTAYAQVGAAHTEIFAGVHETLQTLYERGIPLAVLSNKGRPAIERQLETAGLARFVDLIFAAEADMPNKPDPATFDRRVGPAFPGMPRDRFLMVGDTATDIQFAKNAGLSSCWAAYGYGEAAACRALNPDFEIADFSALSAIIA